MSSYGTISRSGSGGDSEPTTRSSASSFDLIDLSSPVSGEFGSIPSASRQETSFGSIAEEPEQDSNEQEVREEEEPSIAEHHGVSSELVAWEGIRNSRRLSVQQISSVAVSHEGKIANNQRGMVGGSPRGGGERPEVAHAAL